jgi:hypothetical protein
LLVLAEHADAVGANSFPGHDVVVALTESYGRKVREHIEALIADGIINRERRFDPRGHRLNDGYSLNMTAEDLPEIDIPKSTQSDSRPKSTRGDSRPKSTRGAEPRSTGVPGLEAHCVPLHLDEPSFEPPKNHQQQPRAREEVADKEVKAKEAGEKEGEGQATNRYDNLEHALRQAAGLETDPSDALFNLSPIIALLNTGHDLDTDVLPTLRAIARAGRKGWSWGYYARAIEDTKTARERRGNGAAHHNTETKPASAETDESRWRRMFDFWKRTETWPSGWGPPPGLWGCGGRDELPPIPTPLLLGWLLEAARLSPHYVPVHIASAIRSIEERWLPLDDYAPAAAEEKASP